ncbi:uncharacterized protein [Physcomitrium patens]|uniref:Ankyrin repeat domain-containing protein n=1 Tax=Physcomitrium patens TaxID=3218 RepID=A0A2K1J305_PHYPA|nr:ankyrin repeat domain-containing protein 13C-B-like [Physcomitrium patens]PNR35909.1 hypothetical protein PHYPA_021759 [Physcomitrium patens]|eukprot:XP_024400674.1 ankyrin repeat domain-containing protein 13C-B-like [Physcomitrella patens]
MAQLSGLELAAYDKSPVHAAVARRDHITLQRILSKLPRPVKAGEVTTEAESIAAEERADEISKVIDRRDVPGRETPLHLAVRLGDADAVEMLMSAGADWSLQNEQGWSALQEAVCAREEGIAIIITRHYQPMAWAKWCRRLPRLSATMHRMRDFYMEISFHFESSVIPFIGRIAPSDTYRIWKRGSNLRADMTLAGFDGFRIHRSDQSFVFLGDGSEDGKLAPGTLCVLTHKDKEVANALEGAGVQPSENEIAQEVAAMSRTNMYRPGIDVTEAELVAQTSWRRQEKTEMVGAWKAKVHDMHHVQVSVRSRRVPGAMTDEELFALDSDRVDTEADEDYSNLLTTAEKEQLENVLKAEHLDENRTGGAERLDHELQNGNFVYLNEDSDDESDSHLRQSPHENGNGELLGSSKDEKRSRWYAWGKKSVKASKKLDSLSDKGSDSGHSSAEAPRKSKQGPGLPTPDSQLKLLKQRKSVDGRRSVDSQLAAYENQNRPSVDRRPSNVDDLLSAKGKGKELKSGRHSTSSKELIKSKSRRGTPKPEATSESEYKKGLRPILWLTPDYPLKTEELLPLLDILANKVKAVRRLRELLTTKLPPGTFPVKVAIPVVPTIRVVITFTKFEELKPAEEFSTPLSSPRHFSDAKSEADAAPAPSQGSWLYWMRGAPGSGKSATVSSLEEQLEEEADPFMIPPNYRWIDMEEKKRRLREKKGRSKKVKKPPRPPSSQDVDTNN